MKFFSLFTTLLLAFEATKTAHASNVVTSSITADGTHEGPVKRRLKKCDCISTEVDFANAVSDVATYTEGGTKTITICEDTIISIATAIPKFTLPDNHPEESTCTPYSLKIKCCKKKCGLKYTGEFINAGSAVVDFTGGGPSGATLSITLNGVSVFSTTVLYNFFLLPQLSSSKFDCYSTGTTNVDPNAEASVSLPFAVKWPGEA